MFQLAQDVYKIFQERFRTTVRVVADIAESVGVPQSVTSLLHSIDGSDGPCAETSWSQPPPAPPAPPRPAAAAEPEEAPAPEKPRPAPKKRGLEEPMDLTGKVRPLKVEDAIKGSTYLARIVWALGVAKMEGTGALRPADMARMIMSRSPVSLEPPNVARYIRRSKPTAIVVDHTEGNSSFYTLNGEGQALFDEKYRIN